MAIVIIHGPQASGKTRHKEALKQHFKCSRIIDGWDGRRTLYDGDLALTNEEPPFNCPDAQIIDIVCAKALAVG